jgi:hypothetical protein
VSLGCKLTYVFLYANYGFASMKVCCDFGMLVFFVV